MALEDYPKPSVTTDMTIFTIKDNELKVLLIQRAIEPFKESWALPGGFIKEDESLEQTAQRELQEETGVKTGYLEQLYTFGDPKRDPRGRVITTAYFALINQEESKPKLNPTTDAKNAQWFSINNLPELAFDHKKILEYAMKRLKWKFEYTTIAFTLLPKRFTLTHLQEIYEIIFDKKFDKRNFRKKLLTLNILEKTKEKQENVSHRPPQLYSLKSKIGEIVEIL